jgi:hypothetical protein
MKNIKRCGKTGLILLGIVWLGFSFSGCGHSSVLLQIVLVLAMVNTLLLIVGLGVLIGFIIKKL